MELLLAGNRTFVSKYCLELLSMVPIVYFLEGTKIDIEKISWDMGGGGIGKEVTIHYLPDCTSAKAFNNTPLLVSC